MKATAIDTDQQIGKKLKELREYNDFTQEQVSSAIGISVFRYGHIERGMYSARPQELVSLSRLFGVRIAELFYPGDEPKPIDPEAIGRILKEARESRGWSVQQLATQVECTARDWKYIEAGQFSLRRSDHKRLVGYAASMLGVKVDL